VGEELSQVFHDVLAFPDGGGGEHTIAMDLGTTTRDLQFLLRHECWSAFRGAKVVIILQKEWNADDAERNDVR